MGLEEKKVRKMPEIAFKETNTEVTICAQGSGRKQVAEAKEGKEFNTETSIIKAEGQTYTELVKSVKEQVNLARKKLILL